MNRKCHHRWFACLLSLAVGAHCARAADAAAPAAPEAKPVSLSASAASARAPWQQRLTLGPGDLINLELFDIPDTANIDVPVGPDGRINFLQARDVMAAGLTIDELRAKLDEALGQYYQKPRTIVTPSAYNSKKYYVLGAVATRGVFVFDRPLTVIEALARAGGLSTGLYGRDTVELADLGRSFLVRSGQRVPVNFEKLFERGDLTQNLALQPEDFLFFAMANANEIYVLGEVTAPGVAAFLPRTSVLSVIASRGGFTRRAFQSRVLVVRGSLNNPQSFVVDASDILHGKQPDFKLQAKDIVYVSRSPWVMAEEVLDTCATAFIQGFMVNTIARKLPPLTTSPWIK